MNYGKICSACVHDVDSHKDPNGKLHLNCVEVGCDCKEFVAPICKNCDADAQDHITDEFFKDMLTPFMRMGFPGIPSMYGMNYYYSNTTNTMNISNCKGFEPTQRLLDDIKKYNESKKPCMETSFKNLNFDKEI